MICRFVKPEFDHNVIDIRCCSHAKARVDLRKSWYIHPQGNFQTKHFSNQFSNQNHKSDSAWQRKALKLKIRRFQRRFYTSYLVCFRCR